MPRIVASLVLALGLVLVPSQVDAQTDREDLAVADQWQIAMGTAALSTGVFAFDTWLVLTPDDAFGPAPLRAAAFTSSVAGLLGAHAAAFSLFDRAAASSARRRRALMGLSFASTGLSLLGFALPTAWATTSTAVTAEDGVGVAMSYLLGAIGLASLVGGILELTRGLDLSIDVSVAASPTRATVFVEGRF
jgi:hypothetical protein